MVRKTLGKGVAHATEFAFAGLASQVRFLMALQLCGQDVGLATLLTAERVLTCMQALMGMQDTGVSQGIARAHRWASPV